MLPLDAPKSMNVMFATPSDIFRDQHEFLREREQMPMRGPGHFRDTAQRPDEQDIPLRLEYPKIGRIDDAEIVGDRITEGGPVFWCLLA